MENEKNPAKELKELKNKLGCLAEDTFDYEDTSSQKTLVSIIEMLDKIGEYTNQETHKKHTTYRTESGREFQVIESETEFPGLNISVIEI